MQDVPSNPSQILDAVASDSALWSDFLALCDCGGRRAGSESEERALALAQQRLAAIGPAVRLQRVEYAGWRLHDASLTLVDGTVLVCNPLLGSASTPLNGRIAEVCDLGRGTAEAFDSHAAEIAGRFVLVRHEYPFSPQHIHRRRKLAWAFERGAAGFIIANPKARTGPVSGSSGRAGRAGIPAIGTDFESAATLAAAADARITARLSVTGEDYAAETRVLVLDFPGEGPDWVVLSAHLDGHDLAESAMDNATGVAAAVAVARVCGPYVSQCRRGLRVCLFSAEEWALAGSRQYLDSMDPHERSRIRLNVNLDTVAGDDRLTALTSEFAGLDSYVGDVANTAGLRIDTYLPMMANSDHYNFAQHGIPALRLVAGFDRPDSNVRCILTAADTRDKVQPAELASGARAAAALVWRGLTMGDEDIAMLVKNTT